MAVLDTVPTIKSFGVERDEPGTKLYIVVTTRAIYAGNELIKTTKLELPETVSVGAQTVALDAAIVSTWDTDGFEYPDV